MPDIQLPEWHNSGKEPPEEKKQEGWLATEKPPADWFNWLFYTIFKALEKLKSKLGSAEDILSNHVEKGGNTHPNATPTTAGFMSATDKDKWDKHNGAGGTAHSLATTKLAGFMSPEDKDALGSCNKYRSGYDATTQIHTVIEYKRKDGTTYMTSVLTNKVGNVYKVDTRQYYELDGITKGKREVVDITYNAKGDPENEVIRE
ncbi:hypothetical protein [Brevibacillus laterosporus]|uniref:hypothetical protein n=1 Tax=Brevibacillus laterosporus TaxID=1465 RepID=UPI000E6CA182|nr:hypothetical protein [Brevibacillus laterosporus]AYB36817.1 hypothetical protein D5F52_00130 [Brevibacillus laterosporus]AYB41064.1 hypothetical protein D5F52_24025 [Brevibacillus laterosporus]MBM7106981.1 hypothetical protein [Brevibacillus laterosporus]